MTESTNTSAKHVLVCGDLAMDWLDCPTEPTPSATGPSNSQLYPGLHRSTEPGGACLVFRILEAFGDVQCHGVSSFDCSRLAEAKSRYVNSYLRLGRFQETDEGGDDIWRVAEFCGYQSVGEDSPTVSIKPRCRGAGEDGTGCRERNCPEDSMDAVVIDDAGNEFRRDPGMWEGLVSHIGEKTLVVHKLSRPIGDSDATSCFWQSLATHRAGVPFRHLVILEARDLRNEGCSLCSDLSWERAAIDCVRALRGEGNAYSFLEGCEIIVRFGLDGAVVFPATNPGRGRAQLGPKTAEHAAPRLVFDPQGIDGAFERRVPGMMLGYSGAFSAAIARKLMIGDSAVLVEASKAGLLCARSLLRKGFGKVTATPDPGYPAGEVALELKVSESGDEPSPFCDVEIPANAVASKSPQEWSILTDRPPSELYEMARKIVIEGASPSEQRMPVARFGDAVFVDRGEIESFRTLERLVLEYRDNRTETKPLSLAVFGAPGAGKSLAVRKVVLPLLGGKTPEFTFNISEFSSREELARSFHLVHDKTRDGTVPLVFFDEFDSVLEHTQLGWLKFFLAPMQDGKFRDEAGIHPIGKAIFVFAGGTSHSYEAFVNRAGAGTGHGSSDAKVPDFLGRLRGYVNIAGANPSKALDYGCMIRRALALRYLLTSRAESLGQQAYRLLEADGHLKLDEDVLRAFLKVPRYLHGMRSISAIIAVSRLSGFQGFAKSALPPENVLGMHTTARLFNELLARNLTFLACRERLAEETHNAYLRDYGSGLADGDPAKAPWSELPEYLRESNRAQVDDLPRKLAIVGKGIEPSHLPGKGAAFSLRDVERLAKLEHERWMEKQEAQGWIYGPQKDPSRKVHDAMLPWSKLPQKQKNKDVSTVTEISRLLGKVGCRICRLL